MLTYPFYGTNVEYTKELHLWVFVVVEFFANSIPRKGWTEPINQQMKRSISFSTGLL